MIVCITVSQCVTNFRIWLISEFLFALKETFLVKYFTLQFPPKSN